MGSRDHGVHTARRQARAAALNRVDGTAASPAT